MNSPVLEALMLNRLYLKIPGYELLHDIYSFGRRDGYFVSDYELKGVDRYIITADLPDIFDIEISYSYFNRIELWSKYMEENGVAPTSFPININLTIDMSENKIEAIAVNPDISAEIIQPRFLSSPDAYDYDEYPNFVHEINIDRVSISPLGNILLITEKGKNDATHMESFQKYLIADDKGNFYGMNPANLTRRSGKEDETNIIEFYGNVPADAQYLKIIPYKYSRGYSMDEMRLLYGTEYTEIANLPHRFNQNDSGSVLIESCVVTNETITLTYKFEGIVDLSTFSPHFIFEDGTRVSVWYTMPMYSGTTDSYTIIFTFSNPIENPESVKNIGIYKYAIELLEEQAIIIPLK